MTVAELERMEQMTFDEINKDEIIRFDECKVDTSAPVEERILSLLDKGINPYFRKTKDGCIVKISFANNGTTFQENFMSIFSHLV